ncbi:hypothetical protein B0H11DRAFT_2249465 [Mycena galericulata]|nr:hypothetical protein B0H11DRAFT_2249465 [Mycena galericulata]
MNHGKPTPDPLSFIDIPRDQLAPILDLLSRTQVALDEAQGVVAVLHHRVAPVRLLPLDVWLDIAAHYMNELRSQPNMDSAKPFLLAHVSRQWREYSRHLVNYWNPVDLRTQSLRDPESISHFISLVEGPLDVVIPFRDHLPSAALEPLFSAIARWRSVELPDYLWTTQNATNIRRAITSAASAGFPMLSRVSIHGARTAVYDDDPLQNGQRFLTRNGDSRWFVNAPALTCLEFFSTLPPEELFDLPWKLIERYSETGLSERQPYQVPRVPLETMTRLTELETSAYVLDSGPAQFPPICFPHLVRFTLQLTDDVVPPNPFPLLLPQLQALRVYSILQPRDDNARQFLLSGIITLVQRSGASPSHLYLSLRGWVSADDVHSVLRVCPNLRSLTLAKEPTFFTPTFLEHMSDISLTPNLRILAIPEPTYYLYINLHSSIEWCRAMRQFTTARVPAGFLYANLHMTGTHLTRDGWARFPSAAALSPMHPPPPRLGTLRSHASHPPMHHRLHQGRIVTLSSRANPRTYY